jgi:predicted nucleotidyltransferase
MNDTTPSGYGLEELPSGRFLLRIDPNLHSALRAAADQAGLSLNEYCARKLGSGGVGLADPGWQAVERAAAVLGGALMGVAVYGSWARGEPMENSDVDVLVVVDPSTPITRGLYRRWDEEPVRWEERSVEPHFVHLPSPGQLPTGTWAEVALDGIVLFDRNLVLSRRLVELRKRILDGSMERREIHGQPYWVRGG